MLERLKRALESRYRLDREVGSGGMAEAHEPPLRARLHVMAAALIDRLLHHCHIVNIRGNSYRMRQHSDLWQALHAPELEEAPTT